MDQRYRNFFLLLMTFVLMGCGPINSVQFEGGSSNTQSSKAFVAGDMGFDDYLKEIGGKFVLDPFIKDAKIENVKFEKDFGVDFNQASMVLSFAMDLVRQRFMMLTSCSKVGTSMDLRDDKKQYRCGEIPFGDIINAEQKQAFQFDVERQKGKSQKVEYDVKGISIPIYISRAQKSGRTSISHLNEKKSVEFNTESEYLKSSFIKLVPTDNQLYTSVCTYVPGFRVSSKVLKTSGSFKRKFLFVPLRANAKVEVDPGYLDFDYAEICGTFRTAINSQLKPELELVNVKIPRFANLKNVGLKSKVDVDTKGFLAFINGFTKIFGFNIEKVIEKKANQAIRDTAKEEINKIKEGDIQSGAWFSKLVDSHLFDKIVVKDIDSELKRRLVQSGPGHSLNLGHRLEAACLSVGSKLGDVLTPLFAKLCRDSFKLEVGLFLTDSVSLQKGCYSHYFNPDSRKDSNGDLRWWAKSCEIQNRISLTVPKLMLPIYDCLSELTRHGNFEDLPEQCGPEVEYIVNQIQDAPIVEELLERADEIKEKYKDGDLDKVAKDLLKDFKLEDFI